MSDSLPDASGEKPDAIARYRAALGRWFQWLDARLEVFSDYVNPILVKETRQALSSQQFVIWYLLLLAGCWIVTMGGLAMIGPGVYYGSYGGELFTWYCWMLAFPLLVVAPFSAFRSLASEQEDNTRDVLTVSALTPFQLINGKLGGAMLQVGLFGAALAPCLGFAYLLRGLDALTLVLLPAMGVLASIGLSLIGLLLASLSRLRYMQMMLNVTFITSLLVLQYNSYWAIEDLADRGYQYYRDVEFWLSIAAIFSLYVTTCLVVYTLAVASNTFTNANRSTPARIAVVVQQAAFIGWVAGLWWAEKREAEIPALASYVAVFYWTTVGMFVTSEEPELSQRVRRSLPETPVARSLLTWFTPGPGSGYFFVAANLSLVVGLAMTAMWTSRPYNGAGSGIVSYWTIGLMAAYCLGYLGIGRIAILALRRIGQLSLVGGVLVHVLIILGGGAFPYALEASSSYFRRSGFGYLDLPSPVAMLLHAERTPLSLTEAINTYLIVGAVAFCAVLVNLVLAAKELRQTRLPPPQRILEEELSLRPSLTPTPTNPWGDIALSPPESTAN